MSKRQADRLNQLRSPLSKRLRKEKRGVVLLVVVSILTLFLMIGVTYVLVAGNYNKAAGQALRAKTYGDESEREIEDVLGQVLYGTPIFGGNGPRSVISPHSLLQDLYGNDGVVGTIDNYPPNTPNPPPPNTVNAGQCIYFHVNAPAQPIPNYYAGRVITFTDGPAAGLSTRVMEYSPQGRFGPGPELVVEMPESDLPIPVMPSEDSRFIINGAPFNGTGAGYTAFTRGADMQWGVAGTDDDGDGLTDNRTEAGWMGSDDVLSNNLDGSVVLNYTGTANAYAAAYLPNLFNYPSGADNPAAGGFDETWDVPDYQNMFMAFVPPRKLQATVPSRVGNEQTIAPLPILPSFHRPDLVRYWRDKLFGTLLSGVAAGQRLWAFRQPYGPDGRLGTADDWTGLTPAQAQEIVALKRMIILRPLREDHPNFTGGNSNFLEDMIPYYENDTDMNGVFDTDNDGDAVYDVDNDGDGIPESIWVDPGLPVVTSPSGRRYKRLVAICIKDLDGRVNPSVHGNMMAEWNPQARTRNRVNDFSGPVTLAGIDYAAMSVQDVFLPRGLGFGPSEVDFRHILGDDTNVYQNVLQQRYIGPNGGMGKPGFPNQDDGWSQLRTIGMPYDHTNPPLSGYSTPPDVWGRAALAVDYTGQPLWMVPAFPMGYSENERFDDPYEVQWNSLRASVDSPYTVAELEALLRYHDLGASVIPSRLMQPGPNGAGLYLATESRGTPGISQVRRDAFGIGTYIPAPKLIVPREWRATYGGGNSSTILDLYFARLNQDPNQFRTVVPSEFLKGQMFNLNREIGNGQQDQTAVDQAATNANAPPFGTVDDPSEIGSETIPTTAGQYPLNYLNDSTAYDQRQMYARHLYCLIMMLRNQIPDTIDLDGDGMGSQAETARFYAQWAINVVDFRDPDSIMTRFEYDLDPFDGNGWDASVDGDPNTAIAPAIGGVVWGCERPELLITETINFHARRTEDRPDDVFRGNADNGKTTDAGGGEKDAKTGMGPNDFDQRLSPEGSTFIELYNPWFDRGNNVNDHKPAEIYSGGGVDLSKVNSGGSPVWRMIVVAATPPANKNIDPDYPRPEALAFDANGMLQLPPPGSPFIERSIYFADLSGMGVVRPSGDGEAYFPSSAIPRAPVLPGRYAVIGSSGYADGAGNYITTIGRRTTDPNQVPTRPDYSDTRRIILTPNANPNTPQTVRVRDNLTDGADDVTAAPVVALPVDNVMRIGVGPLPQSLNISEQPGGYPGQPGGPALPPPQMMSMWVAPTPTEEGYYSPPIDTPLDGSRMDGGEIFANDVTVVNYRALHLQRLANPLMPWSAVSNPYVTVDRSSMDVMAFNGVAVDPGVTIVRQNFQAFQRGGRYYDSDTETVGGYTAPVAPNLRVFRDLWPSEAVPAYLAVQPGVDSPTESTGNVHFQTRPLYHTLGYLNKRYHGPAMQPFFGAAAGGYFGAPYYQDASGAPASPFPYLPFNNRPFNNSMELLQVPCWNSSQLLMRHSGHNVNATPNDWTSMYLPANSSMPYGHLLNFFQTSDDLNANSAAPEIARLLDYVETRTPYLDTEKYYSPAAFANDPNTPAGYRPPFNYLSRFREPGRININTIFDDNVWNAAVRGFPGMCSLAPPEGDNGLFLSHLVLSRQGYGQSGADILQHDPAYPSLFSNPFRTADSADMMPPIATAVPLRKSPADGGLLRRDLNQYPATVPPMNDPARPLFGSDNITAYQDAARNPYFRYQGLQKIGNLFSTNSNCYAVWITVGYFEVEANDADNNANTPALIDAVHPDGLRLAQEVGVDDGTLKRHRAFFIIDRSIPVGYEPGHRHNTDKAVLLKRFIE